MGNEASIEVKRATVEDMPFLIRAMTGLYNISSVKRLCPFDESAVVKLLGEAIESADKAVFVATNGTGEPVGTFVMSSIRVSYSPNVRFAHGNGCWVDPKHRGKGVGRRLFAEGDKWAEEKGAVGLLMSVGQPNRKSVARSHRAKGFRQIETIFLRPISNGREV